jgi:hypothetical protein
VTDVQEAKLIEALQQVDVLGDVAPPGVHDPMTMVLRQLAVAGDLMRWDDNRGYYVLTGTGRSRISARRRAPGTLVHFTKRGDPEESKPVVVTRFPART